MKFKLITLLASLFLLSACDGGENISTCVVKVIRNTASAECQQQFIKYFYASKKEQKRDYSKFESSALRFSLSFYPKDHYFTIAGHYPQERLGLIKDDKIQVIPASLAEYFSKIDRYKSEKYDGFILKQAKDEKVGFIDRNGELILPFEYDSIEPDKEKPDLFIVRKNDKMALLDENLNALIPFQDGSLYRDKIGSESYFKSSVYYNDSFTYNLYNENGKLLIENYDSISQFHNERYSHLWKVYRKAPGYTSYIAIFDNQGNVILDFIKGYIELHTFTDPNNGKINGFFEVSMQNKHKIFGIDGKEINGVLYDKIRPQSNGLINYRLNDKEGIIDATGKAITNIDYDKITAVGMKNSTLYLVQKNNKFGILDVNGKKLTKLQYDGIDRFTDTLLDVQKNGKFGLLDMQGHIVVPIKYDNIAQYSDGMIAVKSNNKWGILDHTGKKLITPQYENLAAYNYDIQLSDHIVFYQNGKLGIVNQQNKVVLPAIYDDIRYFDRKKATVCKNGQGCGMIDINGSVLVDLKYQDTKNYNDGLLTAQLGDKWGLIDIANNEILLDFEYDKPLNFNESGTAYVKQYGDSFDINRQGERLEPNETYVEMQKLNKDEFKLEPVSKARITPQVDNTATLEYQKFIGWITPKITSYQNSLFKAVEQIPDNYNIRDFSPIYEHITEPLIKEWESYYQFLEQTVPELEQLNLQTPEIKYFAYKYLEYCIMNERFLQVIFENATIENPINGESVLRTFQTYGTALGKNKLMQRYEQYLYNRLSVGTIHKMLKSSKDEFEFLLQRMNDKYSGK
ncbi:WG repeat protein [Cricetibacter osteomyelitidis]|uniref:WG repeat protein n=1 Tax=Cricetibacter osteomyelitidis TaxID=1521931 RepID=A0A4R2T8C9_9PAST|nr:WG repeat-containing protein [Cricetibacter osteomyelitidis]TCP93438.1 WG repeat protein [Cricetibacter osteomyelitidis]